LQIRGPSKRKHVHGCSLVRAKNLYGYHASEELFMKIYLYPQFIHFHKSNCLQMCQHHLLYPSLFSVKGICWKVWICLSHSFLSNQLTAETAKLELIFGHLLQLLNLLKSLNMFVPQFLIKPVDYWNGKTRVNLWSSAPALEL